MKQHAIDLMPAAIRARSQAGVRAGRCIGAAALAISLMVITATHSRLRLTAAQRQIDVVKARAEDVLAIDAQAAHLKRELGEAQAYIDLYQKVSFPLDVSAVMATVINSLPPSVTLDQFDLDAGVRTIARSPRSRGIESKQDQKRVLTCEISGFAGSDEHIAQLVSRLEATAPFRNVNLDFSRTKKVYDRDAREFRLSFRIDLNATYEVVSAPAPTEQVGH